MIGWQPKPFIFVHIPKCAGTSIEQALLPYSTPYPHFKDVPEGERRKYWLPCRGGLQHAKLRRYGRRFLTDNFFKFAFVRNPWDRAVSQIHYLKPRMRGELFSGRTFKEDLLVYCTTKRSVRGHDLGATQWGYIKTSNNECGVDYVGRFESLSKDFTYICQKLDALPIPILPHIFNSQRNAHYSTYYDDESVELVRARFAEDIRRFDYEFEDRR